MTTILQSRELDAFERKYGYKPTAIPVAIDALAVYVNKDNPIEGMTIPQVDAVMSSTRKCGYPTDITTWGDLGLTGSWKNSAFSGVAAIKAPPAFFVKATALTPDVL
jgi:phosphate transport system substrate-binding protein